MQFMIELKSRVASSVRLLVAKSDVRVFDSHKVMQNCILGNLRIWHHKNLIRQIFYRHTMRNDNYSHLVM